MGSDPPYGHCLTIAVKSHLHSGGVMSKPTIILSAIALAGCASTSGWRALQIDGSNRASFDESVAVIQQELPSARGQRFALALQDIWITGSITAADDAGGYTQTDYFEQLDGLGYKEVMSLADSTGLLGGGHRREVRRAPRNDRVGWGRSDMSAGNTHGWGTQDTDPFDPPQPTGWR